MRLIRFFLGYLTMAFMVVVALYCWVFWGDLAGPTTPLGKLKISLIHEYDEAVSSVKNFSFSDLYSSNDESDEVGQIAATSEPEIVDGMEEKQSEMVVPEDNTLALTDQQQGAYGDRYGMYAPYQSQPYAPLPSEIPAYQQQQGKPEQPLQQPLAMSAPAENKTPAPAQPEQSDEKKTWKDFFNLGVAKPDVTKENTKSSDSEISDRELWVSAREAFLQKDIEGSIRLYKQLILNTENNYDAYGELGNVYFQQKRWKDAAASYFEAARILINKGQVERGASAIGLLYKLDPEKADELQKVLKEL